MRGGAVPMRCGTGRASGGCAAGPRYDCIAAGWLRFGLFRFMRASVEAAHAWATELQPQQQKGKQISSQTAAFA